MRCVRLCHWLIASVAATLLAASAGAQTTVYVDDDAAPAGDGFTWATAHRFLQDGLAHAAALTPPVEVRVAQGIYQPDLDEAGDVTPLDHEATFMLLNDVALLGGYAGQGAPDPDARDIDLYVTTLSGDLLGDDQPDPDFVNYADNSWHVVTGSGTLATAVIEGFTITAGNASGTPYPEGYDAAGAGMFNEDGHPTVRACTFAWNRALDGGAGMFNFSGSGPVVTGCTFANNRVEENLASGGGILNIFGGHPQILECTFTDNIADVGGGMFNRELDQLEVADCSFEGNTARMWGGGLDVYDCSDVSISRCAFTNNTASLVSPNWAGGGLRIEAGSGISVVGCTFEGNQSGWGAGLACVFGVTDVTVISCRFTGNIAAGYGGGMAVQDAAPLIVNCLFIDNEAENYGGGLHTWTGGLPSLINATFIGNAAPIGGGVYNYQGHGVTMRNCIVWDNGGAEIGGEGALVEYSDVQGGYAGEGNIDIDPKCRDLANDDMRLASESPCIDAGDNTAVPADELDLDGDGDTMEPIPFDLAGLPRFVDDPDAFDTGNPDGVHSLVDMGAYEFCRADAVPDGVVDVQDLVAVILAWGGDDIDADTNADGIVDVQDLVAVVVNWGPCE